MTRGAGGFVAGVIIPAKTEGEKPTFEIVPRGRWNRPEPDVRPCEHSRFILDEEWATVTCGTCREKVDPFAALLWYARIYESRIKHEFQRVQEAEKNLHAEELRRLSKLRDASEDERKEIADLLARRYERTLTEMRDTARRIGRAIADRKREQRGKRRQKQETAYQQAVARSRAAVAGVAQGEREEA